MCAFRCAASCNPTKSKPFQEPLHMAIQRLDEMMYRILETCDVHKGDYKAFLSGDGNFRYLLNSNYKANRKTKEKPKWLDACREHMVVYWGASVTEGYEADDAIGLAANEHTIICSNDKDFLQIPGRHYNPVTNINKEIDDDTAQRNFWSLMLIGDTSDNVRGVDGIGVKHAARILDELDVSEMYERVLDLYDDDERFITNYYLLRILRSEDELAAVHQYLTDRSHRALERMAQDAQELGLYD